MNLSQCLFATKTPTNAVSVLLAEPSLDNRTGARDFWQQQFHRDRSAKQKPEAKFGSRDNPKEGEEFRNARPIKGLGDEAYWSQDERALRAQRNSFCAHQCRRSAG